MSSESAVTSRRQLAIQLERVQGFESPESSLEQYVLDSEAASELLWRALTENQEFPSMRVLDLGCGTGVLSIGAGILGASLAVGVDIDRAALMMARKTAREMGTDAQTEWVLARVPEIPLTADLIVQNPPFGVKSRGSDREFLKTAIQAGRIVYSIHLASNSSREFLQRFIEKQGARLTSIIPIIIRIRRTLPRHRERLHGVRAEVYKIVK